MKRKLGRWLIGGLIAVILLFVAFLLSLDSISRFVAERRIRAETGMKAKIGKFSIGLKTSTIHIQNFVLENPHEFGGGSFVEMPELFLDYDREKLRSGKLHLNLVRIEVAKVHIVENKDGKKNVDILQQHQHKSRSGKESSKSEEPPFVFDGLDTLEVTLGTVQFTSVKNPNQNMKQALGIQREIFKNLKTEKDFQTAAALLTLKAGASLWLSGELSNPASALFNGSFSGEEPSELLNNLPVQLPETPAQKTP